MNRTVLPLLAAAIAGASSFAPAAQAGIFGHKDRAQAAAQAAAASSADADIQRAIEEERYVDARNMLDQAVLADDKDPMLSVLVGELGLAQKSYEDSLAKFKEVDNVPSVRARALQGEGVALAGLGRSKDAIKTLEAAVAADPNAWRAWDVLGQEYDDQRDWAHADAAYDHAMAASGGAAIVLNNRGFSRLLQHHLDEAAADFVKALERRPGMTAARTNLRLALAMRGDYDRATQGGVGDDKAAVLNNAGFAAMVRGDYDRAETLFGQAIKAKGEYYARAATNLEMVQALKARAATGDKKTASNAP